MTLSAPALGCWLTLMLPALASAQTDDNDDDAELSTDGDEGWICRRDDVVTTGATLREAERALAAAGLPVLAAATLAATRRKVAGPNFG